MHVADAKHFSSLPPVSISPMSTMSGTYFMGTEAQLLREAGHSEIQHLRKVLSRRKLYQQRLDAAATLFSRLVVECIMQGALEVGRFQVVGSAIIPGSRLGRSISQRLVGSILMWSLRVFVVSIIVSLPRLHGRAIASLIALLVTYPLETVVAQLSTRRNPNLHITNIFRLYRGVGWAVLKLVALRLIFTKGANPVGSLGALLAHHSPWVFPHSHALRCPALVGVIAHAVVTAPLDFVQRAAQTAPLPTPPALATARLMRRGTGTSSTRSLFSSVASTFASAITSRTYVSLGSVRRWVRYATGASVASTTGTHASRGVPATLAARGRRLARQAVRVAELVRRDARVTIVAIKDSFWMACLETWNGAGLTYQAYRRNRGRVLVAAAASLLLAVVDAVQAGWTQELLADTFVFALWQRDSAEKMSTIGSAASALAARSATGRMLGGTLALAM